MGINPLSRFFAQRGLVLLVGELLHWSPYLCPEGLILMLKKQDLRINSPSQYFQSRDLVPILKFIYVGIDPHLLLRD